LGARTRKELTLSQQSDAILALSYENASKSKRFAKRPKMLWLQSLDSVVHIVVNRTEVISMALTANQLARRLNCAWVTVRRAIKRGELKAVWDEARREWLIEEGRELAFFRARLDYLRHLRRERAERMRLFWKIGRLKPRRRKQVPTVVVERLKRPLMVTVGQGATARTVGIVWQGDEGQAACPCCASLLRIR
jgi:hypothetical protein